MFREVAGVGKIADVRQDAAGRSDPGSDIDRHGENPFRFDLCPVAIRIFYLDSEYNAGRAVLQTLTREKRDFALSPRDFFAISGCHLPRNVG